MKTKLSDVGYFTMESSLLSGLGCLAGVQLGKPF
jgi:hypothetical protein